MSVLLKCLRLEQAAARNLPAFPEELCMSTCSLHVQWLLQELCTSTQLCQKHLDDEKLVLAAELSAGLLGLAQPVAASSLTAAQLQPVHLLLMLHAASMPVAARHEIPC